jgi:hypothetical protein
MGEGEERGFLGGLFGFWFLAEIGLLGRGRLTDFLVGVGKPQHIVSGSSALEAS